MGGLRMRTLPATPEVAARKGAEFIIEVTDRVFDDFAATGADRLTNLKLLGVRG
jgi:hypothetical protein